MFNLLVHSLVFTASLWLLSLSALANQTIHPDQLPHPRFGFDPALRARVEATSSELRMALGAFWTPPPAFPKKEAQVESKMLETLLVTQIAQDISQPHFRLQPELLIHLDLPLAYVDSEEDVTPKFADQSQLANQFNAAGAASSFAAQYTVWNSRYQLYLKARIQLKDDCWLTPYVDYMMLQSLTRLSVLFDQSNLTNDAKLGLVRVSLKMSDQNKQLLLAKVNSLNDELFQRIQHKARNSRLDRLRAASSGRRNAGIGAAMTVGGLIAGGPLGFIFGWGANKLFLGGTAAPVRLYNAMKAEQATMDLEVKRQRALIVKASECRGVFE